MLVLIKRQECLNKYVKFPTCDYATDQFFYPKVFASHLLTLNSKSIVTHIKRLALATTQVVENLGYDGLIFLGDSKIPWLYQNNNYKPVQEAIQYLITNKVGKRFNGALQVAITELPVFLKHFFWLRRCNASLPIFHFVDSKQNIVGSICQYGNLHLDSLNKKTEKSLENIIKLSNFEYLDTPNCYSPFTNKNAIKSRQIML